MGKKSRIVDLESLGSHYTRNKNLFLYNNTSSQQPQDSLRVHSGLDLQPWGGHESSTEGPLRPTHTIHTVLWKVKPSGRALLLLHVDRQLFDSGGRDPNHSDPASFPPWTFFL